MVDGSQHKLLGFACVPLKNGNGTEIIPVFEGDKEKYEEYMLDIDPEEFKVQTKEEFEAAVKAMANTPPISNEEITKQNVKP